MEEINIGIKVEATSGRSWTAEAASQGCKGIGTGSSKSVAVSRAVGNLVESMEEEVSLRTSIPDQKAFNPTHWINAGEHENEKCMVIGLLAENSKGEPTRQLVQYEDGRQGEERSRFLRCLAHKRFSCRERECTVPVPGRSATP